MDRAHRYHPDQSPNCLALDVLIPNAKATLAALRESYEQAHDAPTQSRLRELLDEMLEHDRADRGRPERDA